MFDYNPGTGELLWKRRPVWTFHAGKTFTRDRNAAIFNSRFPGSSAACIHTRKATKGKPSDEGRVKAVTTINNSHHLTTRTIWKLMHDEEPEQVICINGDNSDLRLKNLQATNELCKSKHHTLFSHNTSGHRGVSLHRLTNRWRADIKINQKSIFLGLYPTPEAAAAVRRRAEAQYGWRPKGL